MSEPMKFSVQELRPEVLAFALLMEKRLREKDVDSGMSWKAMRIDDLGVHAITKTFALEQSIKSFDGGVHGSHYLAKHAADLANYCMMISDVSGELLCGSKHDGIPCTSPKGSHCPDCKGMHEYHGE